MNTKFHPILFSTEMVQAILANIKNMTRIIMKQQPVIDLQTGDIVYPGLEGNETVHSIDFWKEYKPKCCPYGKVGDVLWVRETFQYIDFLGDDNGYVYKATDPDWDTMDNWKWKPSIFMPKQACRIFLKIKSIIVERLQDISEQDAIAEGIEGGNDKFKNYLKSYPVKDFIGGNSSAFRSFQSLWKNINGEESWKANPWVWVIEFERIEKPENFC